MEREAALFIYLFICIRPVEHLTLAPLSADHIWIHKAHIQPRSVLCTLTRAIQTAAFNMLMRTNYRDATISAIDIT